MDGVSHSVVVFVARFRIWSRPSGCWTIVLGARRRIMSCVGWALYLARDEKDWEWKKELVVPPPNLHKEGGVPEGGQCSSEVVEVEMESSRVGRGEDCVGDRVR